MGISRWPSGYQLEVTCIVPCHWKERNLYVLHGEWKIHTCLGMGYSGLVSSSLPKSGVGKEVCVWGCPPPQKKLHLSPVWTATEESEPPFLKKTKQWWAALVSETYSPPCYRWPAHNGLCDYEYEYTAKHLTLFSFHPPTGIVMKPSLLRFWAGHSLT